MDYNLLDLGDVLRSWGRGVVFYAPLWTPGLGDPLVLTHLGDTEGDIVVATNADVQELTTPELTGGAAHEADYMGEKPSIDIPLYLADPALLAVVSPIGSAHAGRSRRSSVSEYTLALFPENLFLLGGVRKTVAFAGGVWTFDGGALTAAQAALVDQSFWLWRAYFSRPQRRFRGGGGNDRKNIESVTAMGMQHPDMPEGHQLYTTGDPADAAIDIEGGS